MGKSMNMEKFGEGAQKLGVLGIKITQNGVLTAEQLWDDECRRNVYSASKSFTSCAVGFAVKEGLVSLFSAGQDVIWYPI